MNALFDELSGIQQSMEYHLKRHGVLSSNLANADTPGFVPRDLSFDSSLEAANVAATHPDHINAATMGEAAYRVETQTSEIHLDKSGSDLERAMSQVTANRLRYETALELAKRRVALLRYAASDGGTA